MAEKQKEKEATIRTVPGGWRLVEYGEWQVSVAPDGLLMLPRHLHPGEVDDFIGAVVAAAEVARKVIAVNAKNTKEVDLENLPSSAAIVTEGEPPPGAVKMTVTERGPTPRGSIGRPKGRDARRPRVTPPPQPPGGRNGRTR